MRDRKTAIAVVLAVLLVFLLAFTANRLRGHCDALDGPVVLEAKSALEKGDVTPVLKWVKPADEKEIRKAFAKALKVRALAGEAREVADLHFFETVVRVHRAGEGVAYSGLKPAGAIAPGIAAADKALEQESADKLADEMGEAVAAGVRDRFAKVVAAKAHPGQGVEAGRAYVVAYTEYVHYVEAVHKLASSPASEHHHIHAPGR